MGLFDTIKGLVIEPLATVNKQLFQPIAQATGNKVLGAFGNVAATAEKVLPAVAAGIIAAPVIGAAAKSPAGQTTLQSLVPKSAVGKVVAGVGGLASVGAIIRQPNEAIKAAVKAPASIVNFGGNVADTLVNPSLANVEKTFKDNPIVTSLVGAGALVSVGGGIGLAANTIATVLNTRATNVNSGSTDTAGADMGMLGNNDITGNQLEPIIRATETQRSPTTRKKYKKRVTAQAQAIRITNKNFINNSIYNRR